MSGIYLVQLNDSKRIVRCQKCELHKAIAKEFDIESAFVLTQWNNGFEEWIDLDNLTDLPDKAKLSVKLTVASSDNSFSGSDQPCTSTRTSQTTADSSTIVAASTELQTSDAESLIEDVPHSSSMSTGNTELSHPPLKKTAPTSLISCRVRCNHDWIVDYKLPQMPFHIKASIDTCNGNTANLTSSTRRAINQWLYNDIILYTLYPSSLEYRSFAIALVKEFPFLADKNERNKVGTWVDGISQKFKDARRSMTHLPEVMKMKKKYGTKKPRPPVVETETTPAKRRFIQTEETEEDEHSMAAHIKDMTKEFRKNVKNVELIRDRMKRTFMFRQKEAKEGLMTVNAIVEKYPAFQFPVVIFDGAERIFKLDLKSELQHISPSVLSKIKKRLSARIQSAPDALLELLKENEIAEVLCLLPLTFNNKLDMFIQLGDEDQIVTTPYPCILATEHGISVYVQKCWLCNCTTLEDAILVVITSYWMFDIKFPKALTCALQLLCHLLNISENVTYNMTVQKFDNSLQG